MLSEKHAQWIGAAYAEDVQLIKTMLSDDADLANFEHTAFDNREKNIKFLVATSYFVVNGLVELRTGRVRKVNLDIVKLLLEAGADPNIKSAHGYPLSTVKDENVARLLIDAGADPNLAHGNGGTPANFAIWQFDPERLYMLFKVGADPLQKTDEGFNLLHQAAQETPPPDKVQPHLRTIQILSDAGIDPNEQVATRRRSEPVRSGYTPLHIAASCNTAEIVETMVDIGCDPKITNSKGETPQAVARRVKRDSNIISILEP